MLFFYIMGTVMFQSSPPLGFMLIIGGGIVEFYKLFKEMK